MVSTHSRSDTAGVKGTSPCRLACLSVHAPGARTTRPPVSSSSDASVWAITSGDRRRTTCVHPRVIVVVARPKAVMAVTESRLQSSASEKKNMSYPRLST